ncbi:MAG: hypothetical protein MUF15_12515 [Acidobacteria bacterium]|jgi:hypothetical protein|nr:hypothetical protein [Acidobacteriota bacterium]
MAEDKKKETVVERIGFGVKADSDKYPKFIPHADRFLVIELENRKNVISRTYYDNPYARIMQEKFPKPSNLGDIISKEEMEILTNLAKFVKEELKLKYLYGYRISYFFRVAMEKIGQHFNDDNASPDEHIKRFIDARQLAGFPF